MNKLQALTELRDKVKAGGDNARHHAAAFPSESAYGHCTWHDSHKASQGSLDAAKALQEAVLPKWHWSIYDTDGLKKACAQVEPPEYSFEPFTGIAREPARAWLLAILEALIAQEASHD